MNLASLGNLPHFVSWDFLMIVIVFLIFTFLGIVWRKKRILTVTLSLYLARLFFSLFSLPKFFENVKIGNLTSELFFFWTLFILSFLVLVLSGISFRTAPLKRKRTKARFLRLKGGLYGFFAGGLFISFCVALMGPTFLASFSLLSSALFASELGRIVWIIMPLVAMIIFK